MKAKIQCGYEELVLECKKVHTPENSSLDYVVITVDSPESDEKNHHGDWQVDPHHVQDMIATFFKVNREVSELMGGNDTPRHKGEEIEVLFADDPFDGYMGVKVLVFDLEKYKVEVVEEKQD